MSKLMRSLGIFGTAGERGTSAIASQRPDMLRRKTIAANARILVAASLLLMPVAMWALIAKAPIGFLLASIGLAAGMVSLSLHHRDRSGEAAIVQVGAVTLAGIALTLIDPRRLAGWAESAVLELGRRGRCPVAWCHLFAGRCARSRLCR
jgi:cell cycle sensor histidine kinase DivJ